MLVKFIEKQIREKKVKMGKNNGFRNVEERNRFIIEKQEEGLSDEEIAALVNLSVRQIRNIYKAVKCNGRFGRKKGSGRRKAISKGQAISMKNDLRHNPFKSLRDIKRQRKISASTKTMSRYLRRTGWSRKKASKIPKLDTEHKDLRFEWAKNHENYDWSNVIFSDECSFFLGERIYGWAKKEERITQESLSHNPKIQVWGSMYVGGILSYEIFEGTMTGTKYLQMLKENLVPIAEAELGEDWVFQQDNAGAHTEKNVKKFLQNEVPECLAWPSRSPDINPMENIWGRVKQNVYSHNPANIEELQNYIEQEMDNIPENYCQNLISSMDNRVKMLIEKEGDVIPY